jgi:transporter family-2 protein
MKAALFIVLAVVAGLVLPIQAALNAKLSKAVGDPFYGTFLTFIVGMAGLFLYLIVGRVDFAQIQNTQTEHWSIWLGGLLGAFYVASLIILTPRLGVAVTLGLTVAGQMAFSLVMDHYGWLGIPVQEINWYRMLGISLVVGGVWLIQTN